ENTGNNVHRRSTDESTSKKDTPQTKSVVSKRSLITATIQRSSKFTLTNSHNIQSLSTKDNYSPGLSLEEKLIRPSVSA
ncbi:unnamed protein product, partial [Rotaria magnacalcarata]